MGTHTHRSYHLYDKTFKPSTGSNPNLTLKPLTCGVSETHADIRKGTKKKKQQKKSSRQCSERDPLSGLYPLTDLGAEDNAASPPHCSEIPKLGKVKTHLNNLCMRVYL